MKKQQTSRKLALLGAGIALAGMTLAGQAQAATLTGSPVADGYTPLGTLHDPGVWIDSGSSIYALPMGWGEPAASGDVPFNAALYTKSFILGAGDTASSVMGSFQDTTATPKVLTTAPGWVAGDAIFSIGVVAIDGASSGSQQHLFFGFKQTDSAPSGAPWAASTTPFNTPSQPDGNAEDTGNGPGDLTSLMFNVGTHNPLQPALGNLTFKDSAGNPVQYGPPAGAVNVDPYLAFFNGDAANRYFTEGLLLINKSEVERQWLSLGGGARPGPFADMIDFSLFYTGNNGSGMWNVNAPASKGVFFDVPTTVPEPASIGLLALGAMLLAPRRRKSS